MITQTIDTLDEVVPFTSNYFEDIALRNNALVTTVFPQFNTAIGQINSEVITVNGYSVLAGSYMTTASSKASEASASALTASTKATESLNSAISSANSALDAQAVADSMDNTAYALTQIGVSLATVVDGELVLSYASPITNITIADGEVSITY